MNEKNIELIQTGSIENVHGLTVSEFVNFIYVSCIVAYSVK